MSFRPALLALFLSGAAAAQQQPPETSGVGGQNQPNASGTGSAAFSDPSQLFSGQAGAYIGVAFTKIGSEGTYASTIISTEFSLGPLGVGLALPLNLMIWNNDKCCDGQTTRDSKTYSGLIRKRDWIEPQDYLKLVRFLRCGHKRDPVYFLAGQLWGASIGHGTLVSRYSNSLSLDHPKLGLALDLDSTFVGIETLTDFVADPTLLGTRVYLRPFGDTPFARDWAVGFTFVTDRHAPRALQYLADGVTIDQDAAGNPRVAASDAVYAGGIDTEFEVLRNSIISLIPYVDLNRIAGAGNGLHAGILTDIYFPIPFLELNLQARLEYRVMQPGYIPEYFDQTYDVGRVQYAVGSGASTVWRPKIIAAQDAHNSARDPSAIDRKGYYGELAFGFFGLLQIGGLYQDYEGDANGASLGLFVVFPKLNLIKLSAYYLRKNMKSGFDDAFTLDERSLLAAAVAYKMFGPIYMRAEFQRQWALEPGATQVKAIDKFSAGIATFIAF